MCKNTVEIFTEKVTKNCDLFCDLFCELRFEGQQPLFCKILESLFRFTIFSVNSCPIQTCLVTRFLRFFRILCQFLTIFSNFYCMFWTNAFLNIKFLSRIVRRFSINFTDLFLHIPSFNAKRQSIKPKLVNRMTVTKYHQSLAHQGVVHKVR